MPITLDASSPALVTGANLSSTVTTAAFSPPADTVLVACVIANSSTGGTTTATVTSGGGLVWTQQAVASFPSTGRSGYAAIFTAKVMSALVGITVTVTTAGSTSTTRRPTLRVLVLNDADEDDLVVFAGRNTTLTNNSDRAFTQLEDDSFLIVAACEWNKLGAPSSSDLTETAFDQSGADGVSGLIGYRQLATPGGNTYNLDAAGSGAAVWNAVRIEVRPDPAFPQPDPVGTALLPQALGPDARLAVEIAWGADLAADDATWTWTEVTTDVRQAPGITTSIGRGEEATTSQPATCSLVLDNSTGGYSLGGQSPNWPNVRRNTPVRVQVDPDGSGFEVLFQGYATGFTPSWNLAATVPEVRLSAAGTLRRLIQGSSPLLSSIRRALAYEPNVVAYWPCEDGKNATVIAPVVGSSGMTFTGAPDFAAGSEFDASAPLLVLAGATLDGEVGTYTDTGANQVRALIAFPTEEQVDQAPILRVYTTGVASRWDMRFTVGGAMDLKGYDRFGNLLVNQGAVGFGVKGRATRVSLELTQSGANVAWRFGAVDPDGALSAADFSGTLLGSTCGTVVRVQVNPSGGLNRVTAGHVSVQSIVTSQLDVLAELSAFNGEYAMGDGARFERLCEENAVPYRRPTSGEQFDTDTDQMGPQLVATLPELLREVEQADQGLLYDGVSDGLYYHQRRLIENRAADLTIDAAALRLSAPFGPVDDDQRTRNRVEVRRTGGSSSTVEDATGPMGTAAIGIYDTSVTVNTYRDSATALYAGWFVALGTVEGYRYPTVTIDLRACPELAPAWLALRPGHRLDITGLDAVLPGHPAGTLSLVVEGKGDQISASGWVGTARCTPYAPWRVGLVADLTGDTAEHVGRADTSGAQVQTSAPAGATSLAVATTSGPIWTTLADDYPLTLDVGGVEVTATACVGAASPQTFTVAALPVARAAGLPVSLARPLRAGL